MPPVPLPRHERLNPLQVWQYLRQPQAFAAALRARHGALAPIHFPGADYALVLTPEGAQQVFAQTPGNYDAFWYDSFAGMNGEGSLWVLVGEAHRRERRLFAPATHASQFRAYGEAIRDIARQHLGTWQPGQTVTAVATTKAIALDVIMRLVFGVEDEALMDEGRPILDALTGAAHPLIVFYPKLQRRWNPLFRRYLRAKTAMYAWAGRLIALRRERGQLGDDVLGCLMTARDQDGRPYGELHICNELLSILTAGHITTGVALAWALYELGRHPDVMAKLRAELDSAGGEPDPDAILALPYLSAVCNEAIRLHPILAECARVPIEPVEILGTAIPPVRPWSCRSSASTTTLPRIPIPTASAPSASSSGPSARPSSCPLAAAIAAASAPAWRNIRCASAWPRPPCAGSSSPPAWIMTRHDLAMGPKYGVPLRVVARRQPRPAIVPATSKQPVAAMAAVH